MVGVTGVEPTASWTRTKHATNCATPGCCINLHSVSIIRKILQSVKEKLELFSLFVYELHVHMLKTLRIL